MEETAKKKINDKSLWTDEKPNLQNPTNDTAESGKQIWKNEFCKKKNEKLEQALRVLPIVNRAG